jgi:outer membrane protein TolC
MKTKLSILALSIMLATGCSSLPNTTALNNTDNFVSVADYRQSRSLMTGYDVEELRRFVDMGVKSNLDIYLATGNVNKALYNAKITELNSHPSLNASMNASKNRNFDTNTTSSGQYGTSISAGYEVDVWGKLKDQRDVANINFLASVYDRETITISTISAIELAYFKIAYMGDVLNSNEYTLEYYEDILKLVKVKYESGSVGKADVIEAERSYVEQQKKVAELELENDQSYNNLLQLVNLGPDEPYEIEEPSLQEVEFQNIPEINVNQIEYRPDVQVAKANLAAALVNIDITKKSYYPALNLTTSLGTSTDEFKSLLRNPIGTIGASIAFPFLNWNERKFDIAISKNDFDMKVAETNKVYLNALYEVDNAIKSYNSLLEQYNKVNESYELSKKFAAIQKVKYNAGETELKNWLDAEDNLRQSDLTKSQMKYNLIVERNNLYKALGGKI